MDTADDFRAVVAGRQRALLRTAWLLTGTSATAEDLVPTRTRVVVVAPDGYTSAALGARTAPVRSNAAVLETEAPAGELVLTGPAVPRLRYDLAEVARGAERPDTAVAAATGALAYLARAAGRDAQEHGSTAGFADEVRREQGGGAARRLVSLGDTGAVARSGAGGSLAVDLSSGEVEESPC